MTKNQVIEYLVTKIEDDQEPLFLLRGRDLLASHTVLQWCEAAMREHVNQRKIDEAQSVAMAMSLYQGPKRLPD